MEANSEFEASECLYQANAFSNADSQTGPPVPYQGYMDHGDRLEGRIPAYPHMYGGSAVAAFSDRTPGLRFQMPPIWTVDRPQSFHTGGHSGGRASEATGHQHMPVLGRLADLQPIVRGGYTPHKSCDLDRYKLGVPGEPQEVMFDPDSDTHISGRTVGPDSGPGTAIPRASDIHHHVHFTAPGPDERSSTLLAESTGFDGQPGGPCPQLQISHETHATAPSVPLQAGSPHTGPHSSGNTRDAGGTGVVDVVTQLVSGDGVPPSPTLLHGHDRRISLGVGGTPRGGTGPRPVVPIGIRGPRQPTRAMGGPQDAPSLRASGDGASSAYSDRQLDSGSLPEQTGRHTLESALQTHENAASVVFRPLNISGCLPYRRGSERPGRQSLQGSSGQEPLSEFTQPRGNATDLQGDRSPGHRSVRDQCQQESPEVLFAVQGARGFRDGRFLDLLGRPHGVRLPSSSTHRQSDPEDREDEMSGNPRGTLLAQPTVVSSSGGPTDGPTKTSAKQTRHSPESQGRALSGRGVPAVDCVAIVRRRYREIGFSRDAAGLAASGRRMSTNNTYSNRLGVYFAWCDQKGFDPLRAPVNVVADFLTDRFQTGLQAGTVRNYKSAIQAVHLGFADGSSLAEADPIRQLLNGMFNSRPPPRKLVPAWDLNTLLNFLKDPPFEPLSSASLEDLTHKVVVLVALACGRRCSELHALAVGDHLTLSRAGATLYFRPGFLAKNERSSFTASPIFLPDIAIGSSVSEDRFWCPVRALRYYLKRTKLLRDDTDQLFVTSRKPHKAASKRSIARWICEVIHRSGAIVKGRVTAHSTRAVASSTAFLKGVTAEEVINTVAWKTASTFSTTYLRDLPPADSTKFARAVLTA